MCMQADKHPEYDKESEQLGNTVAWIKAQTARQEDENAQLMAQMSMLHKEVRSAMDERLILKQQMLLAGKADLDKFYATQATPYFGCIRFQEKYQTELEEVYIGKFGLYDKDAGKMLVLDWRAPMATVYYSGLDESVGYQTPKGRVEGRMHLKRRYVIEASALEEIYDEKSLQERLAESIAGDSSFLIDSLSKTSKGRLKEIVATIQQQQHAIIRSGAMHPIIVQGVAGSGKTTIALHRMAYLIYNSQQQHQQHKQYMVVAPNKLFLNYIQAILPDLGVEDVVQTTFEAFALQLLGKGFKLTKAPDKLDQMLCDTKKAPLIALGARLRGSIVLKQVLDARLRQLEQSIVPKQHVMYEGMLLFTYKEIQRTFLVSNKHMSLQNRVKQLGLYLKKRLKDKTPLIQQAIEQTYRKRLNALKADAVSMEAIRPQIIALYDERDAVLGTIPQWITSYVKTYMQACALPTVQQFYQEALFSETVRSMLTQKYATEAMVDALFASFVVQKQAKYIETEDLGPLVYTQLKLYGMKAQTQYAHIIVDEAQDLDEMKLTVLREVSSNDAFTLVGDLSQGIYDYKGITNWERMMQRVFPDKQYQYFEMTTSYRSTIEIIALANQVIRGCPDFEPVCAEPVLRHGEAPKLVVCGDEKVRTEKLVAQIKALQAEGMHTICVVTQHRQQSEQAYKLLKKYINIQWIGDETTAYTSGVVVMPSYLTKGLEFDAVCVYDVSHQDIVDSRTLKLLYVMITRALHKVFLYSVGEPMAIIRESLLVNDF